MYSFTVSMFFFREGQPDWLREVSDVYLFLLSLWGGHLNWRVLLV
jgi:hypothetical protein